jgi:hypothetical protein
VQLDKTLIVIRERGMFDTLDLALQVCRIHVWPLTLALCLGAIPCAVVNHWLAGWMVQFDPDAPQWEEQVPGLVRYVWTMVIMIVIEAPLASAFVTAYLGKAVFLESPSMRAVVRDVLPQLPQVAWCHLLLRGVLPALLLLAVADRDQAYSLAEILLTLLLLAVLLRRVTAPFLNEIVLLERNPLRARDPQAMTARKRSHMLHASQPGNLFNFALITSCVAILLTTAMFGTLLCAKGIFLDDWTLGPGMFVVGAPLSLWATAGFLAIVHFLAYLDLRISNEGWEVELRMRAEGNRLTGHTT